MSFRFRCLKCGKSWGEAPVEEDGKISHGICLECFAKWFNEKRERQGLDPCFGNFDSNNFVCNNCLAKEFCKEYNGIK